MTKKTISLFSPYPFVVGEKITISEGPRRGDWEVIGISERKVKLKCPVSHREFEWDNFCFLVDKTDDSHWPA